MKNTYKNLIIFSVEKDTLSIIENHEKTNHARSVLTRHGFDYIESKGIYTHLNGRQSIEVSFIVVMPDSVDSDRSRRIMTIVSDLTQDQESVLIQSTDGVGQLRFKDGTVKTLGKYTEINSTRGVNAYTSANGINFSYQ